MNFYSFILLLLFGFNSIEYLKVFEERERERENSTNVIVTTFKFIKTKWKVCGR